MYHGPAEDKAVQYFARAGKQANSMWECAWVWAHCMYVMMCAHMGVGSYIIYAWVHVCMRVDV